MKRHLIFSLYPRRPEAGWWRSVRELTAGARWTQFDGITLVAVAEDDCTETRDAIRAAFPPGTEFLFAANSPALQETEQFVNLLERVACVAEADDLILRAHSKSCTHAAGSASHLWLRTLASTCLDFPRLIESALERAHVCGPFRSVAPLGSSRFHFAGAWYWMQAGPLLARDWRRVDRSYFGAEAYPGMQFTWDESHCIFADRAHSADLYRLQYQEACITPALEQWRDNLRKKAMEPLCAELPPIPVVGEADPLWLASGLPAFAFRHAGSGEPGISETDVLLIDSNGSEELAAELELHAGKVRRVIVLQVSSRETGLEIAAALETFLVAHPEWSLAAAWQDSHGITVLTK